MKKPLFNKICIVGVGLIGGSIGLGIKKRGLANEVVGIAQHSSTLAVAKRRGAIKKGYLQRDLKLAVKEADLIILSGPIPVIIEQIKVIGKYAKRNTAIIDVGSTKAEIQLAGMKHIDRLMKRLASKAPKFVGCHPMAGSEQGGIENAKPDLFKNSLCFITQKNADHRILEFWHSLGSKTITIDPTHHDLIVARISHLPHILSFALFQDFPVNKVPVLNPGVRGYANLARISRSEAALWSGILISNGRVLQNVLSSFQKKLEKWKMAIRKGDARTLKTYIRQANKRSYV